MDRYFNIFRIDNDGGVTFSHGRAKARDEEHALTAANDRYPLNEGSIYYVQECYAHGAPRNTNGRRSLFRWEPVPAPAYQATLVTL